MRRVSGRSSERRGRRGGAGVRPLLPRGMSSWAAPKRAARVRTAGRELVGLCGVQTPDGEHASGAGEPARGGAAEVCERDADGSHEASG